MPAVRRRPRRGLALGALAAGALGVAVAAAASGAFGPAHQSASVRSDRNLRASSPSPPAARPSRRPARVHAAKRHPAVAHPAAHAAAAATSTVQANPAAATTPPPRADELQARGHELLADGNLAAAIPVLRQAVGAAPPGSLAYAYALFDLGRSLRLAGDPKAAVTVLWQRLQIPNQTGIVRAELELALRALGQQAHAANPGASPGPARKVRPAAGPAGHHHHGHGDSGKSGQDQDD